MPDAALDIATALQTAGLGTLGTSIFISTVLDDESRGTVVPDAALFVSLTNGADPEPFLGGSDAEDIYRVNVQVRVRGARGVYNTPRQVSLAVQEALHKTQGAGYISWIASVPIQLGPDDKSRQEWSINILVTYQD